MLRTLWTMRATQPGRKAGWLVAVLSINFNPTNCLEFINWAFETTWSHGKQHNNMRDEGKGGFWWCCGLCCVDCELLFCILLVVFEWILHTTRVPWDCTVLVNKNLWVNLRVTVESICRGYFSVAINEKNNVKADLLIVANPKFECLIQIKINALLFNCVNRSNCL